MTGIRSIVITLTLMLALSSLVIAHFLCNSKKRVDCVLYAQRQVCLIEIGRHLPRERQIGFSHRAPPTRYRMACNAHESFGLLSGFGKTDVKQVSLCRNVMPRPRSG
jgi:hypothetical protein